MQNATRVLLQSFRKYWHLIALTIFLSLLAAVFEGASLGLLIPFLQGLAEDSVFRTGVEWVDRWILAADAPQLERLYRICGLILIATWLRSIVGYASSAFGIKARAMVVEDLRMRVVDQLQAVALRFYSKTRTGELLNTLSNEMARVGQSLAITVQAVTQGSLLFVYVGFMFWISWELSLLVIVVFGLLAFGLTYLMRLIRDSGERVTRANAQFTSLATEFIGGIRTVVAFNMQKFERNRLHRSTEELAAAIIQNTQRSLIIRPLSQAVISTVLIAVVILAVQYYVLPGVLDIALLLAFLFALFRLLPIVHQINGMRGQTAALRAALDNVASLLQRDDKPYLKNGSRPVETFREAIVFEDVDFAYEPGEPVLEDVNIRIECGQMTALVGASGAGKSTLADLIPRFHDPTSGRILFDGIDLREFDTGTLRSKVAVVSQSTFIFNDTVTANIAYGTPEAGMDQVREAARQANALEFIEEMPEGFDTVLGDRGVRLSGGQRQRIAIARAILRDPEILILDEATSALDSVSEQLVQDSLEGLMEGRTVVAIAHRLSTIESADKVIVLEEGRVVEQGAYDELIARKGQLWEYHSLQFQAA